MVEKTQEADCRHTKSFKKKYREDVLKKIWVRQSRAKTGPESTKAWSKSECVNMYRSNAVISRPPGLMSGGVIRTADERSKVENINGEKIWEDMRC